MGERVKSRDVKRDLEQQSNVEGDQIGGRQGWKDDVTSGAHSDSIRVETEPLAADKTGQHRWYKHDKMDVCRPSTAPTIDHRPPADHPDPPHRRGRLKSRPRSVSNHMWTYQATRTHRGRIGRIECARYVIYGP